MRLRTTCMGCGERVRKGDNYCSSECYMAVFRAYIRPDLGPRIVTVWPESLRRIVTLPEESLQVEEESLQRVCEECGGTMEGRGPKATVCSGACRVKKMRRGLRGA